MDMKPGIRFIALFLIVMPMAMACSSPVPAVTHTPAISPTATIVPTETPAPAATATPESSLTPTQAILALEILEWSEWPYANPSDPSNTDTHVEVLLRNPNSFPVRVNNDEDELRFINAAGEVVYTNSASFWYIWQGEWMLPGETAALSACVCFQNQNLEKKDWESLELNAPLEPATDVAYTLDVEVTLGEVINLAEAHLGGSGLGIETTLTNTSDQVLESIPHRVLARDASGRYVGVAFAGNAVVSFTENVGIQPGDTGSGINVSEIDYIDMSVPLTYEVAAIGIPYQQAATAEVVLPSGTPANEWNGIPIMPGAISGDATADAYQFTTLADVDEIVSFYESALSSLGFEVARAADQNAGYTVLTFQNASTTGMVVIASLGELNGVAITVSS
jgi:hypothetical protein